MWNRRHLPSFVAACVFGCGGQPIVEVGSGVLTFEPVVDGAEVVMACGSQGGQHVWTSVRTQGVAPDRQTVRVTMTLAADDRPVCEAKIADVRAVPAGEWGEITGLRCIVWDGPAADGQAVKVVAEVRDAFASVRVERRFVLRMPSTPCRR